MKTKLVSLDKCEKSTTYRKYPVHISLAMLLLLACCVAGNAQSAPDLSSPARGTIVIPPSSLVPPGEGFRAHTNIQIFVPENQALNVNGLPNGETPASIACIYNLVPGSVPAGCKKSGTGAATAVPTGGSGVIAIVDACDAPNIVNDLNTFYTTFFPTGHPAPKFKKVKVGTPCNNSGWAEEETLDVEWAYAMAPRATIVLVEATSPSGNDLMAAEDIATNIVANNAASACTNHYLFPNTCYGQVSNSWGASEFIGEMAYDTHFFTDDWGGCDPNNVCYFPGGPVTYFASSGDKPGVSYPSAAPSVVSAGGTTIYRDGSGNFVGEGAWSQAGGGFSIQEGLPAYQAFLSGVSKYRATPDLACVSDPASGVLIIFNGNPYIIGGTSVCAPILAGITNAAGNFLNESSSYYEHQLLYSQYQGHIAYPNVFTDVVQGNCGVGGATLTSNGYDLCTGIGSPKTLNGK